MYSAPPQYPAPTPQNQVQKAIIATVITAGIGLFAIVATIAFLAVRRIQSSSPKRIKSAVVIGKVEPGDWRACVLPDVKISASLPAPPRFYEVHFTRDSTWVKDWTAYDVDGEAMGLAIERRGFFTAEEAQKTGEDWANEEGWRGAKVSTEVVGSRTIYTFVGTRTTKRGTFGQRGLFWVNGNEIKYFVALWKPKLAKKGEEELTRFLASLRDDDGFKLNSSMAQPSKTK